MKINIVKNIKLMAVTSLTILSVSLVSGASNSTELDNVKLIDIAGKQRMLSQRIAKDYMYAGEKVAVTKANRQLKKSLSELISAQKKLVESINDPEIKNLLAFVQMSTEDFTATAKEKFSTDNAQLILDLSESMLEGSQYVVDSLKKRVKAKDSVIVAKSGKQRMLAQRIAKYYIAYKSGIKDKNTVDQMKKAVKAFDETNKLLMKNSSNTPEINRKLNDINRLWKIVQKFYLNIEKGGLPLIVFNTTDTITKKMDNITALYVDLYKK